MFRETERKFLVFGEDYKALAYSSDRIKQGYLCRGNGVTVRARVRGEKGYITIKGPVEGISRFEWEKEIPAEEASMLMDLSKSGFIDKIRHLVRAADGHVWEVDEFLGDNEGLVIAEIELESEDEPFDVPEWVGEEVTGNPHYYNSMLLRNPYKNW